MTADERRARRLVMSAVKALGASVPASGRWGHGWEITIDAPDGKHWSVTQCSQLIAHQRNTGPWGIGELWVSLADDIAHGLETCDETCGHLDDVIVR